jgi:hypothetical protein
MTLFLKEPIMSRWILTVTCLIALVVGGFAGAAYDIDSPVNDAQFLKWVNVPANGSTNMGADNDVDTEIYDGDSHESTYQIFIPMMNVDWSCTWDPDDYTPTGEWAVGTGAVVLYKHGETVIQDAKTFRIVAMP